MQDLTRDENTYLDVCIAERGDALNLTSSDPRWFQRQHGLEDGVEFRYAGHDCYVRRSVDTAYFSQLQLCL